MGEKRDYIIACNNSLAILAYIGILSNLRFLGVCGFKKKPGMSFKR